MAAARNKALCQAPPPWRYNSIDATQETMQAYEMSSSVF